MSAVVERVQNLDAGAFGGLAGLIARMPLTDPLADGRVPAYVDDHRIA